MTDLTDVIPVVADAKKAIAKALLVLILTIVAAATGATLMGNYKDAKMAAYRSDVQRAAAEAKAAVIAEAKAQQKAQDDITLASAMANAEAQTKIITLTNDIIKEVPRYVTVTQDARTCVTYGLVRVLDAAATGRNPADLQLPSGVTDDACAPITASALAAGIADNFGIARQNAAQLDTLIADTKAREAARNPVVSSPPVASYDWGISAAWQNDGLRMASD